MTNESALKKPLRAVEGTVKEIEPEAKEYDDALHERFLLWKDQSGNSAARIASMINRSEAAISQYINRKYKGNISEVEKDIANLLQREEDLELAIDRHLFCDTHSSVLIWEVLQFCDETRSMGVAVGPSGSGKTETVKEYKRRNRSTIFITCDIASRHVGSVLRLIAKRVTGTPRVASISGLLHAIIERLKGSRRLIVIDDAHFLTWEAFEAVRKIHDCAGIGIAYLGQERLYDQMKGATNRAFLFDQIYSRITIKRDDLEIKRADVRKIANQLYPGLDKHCVDFLFKKALGKGRLRVMSNILKVAVRMNREFQHPIDLELLQEAARFLMI